eukprot:CAMPEP_0185771132 /NCGR_PEP_ID=MMETSP1174-20130828/63307_1 /TAXON_ID=35687 /ORGANISM="Dictyocha speculum, Strain CCMP1381" /LENGTH=394 /DNA_ID=CAMNT_0028456885 /DNA_START=35 /DNA_END=1219 /DNA_ORIENTATION=-
MLAEITEDSTFIRGRQFLNDGDCDDAIELFEKLLQSVIESSGELSLAAGPIYMQYGNALLMKAEESSQVFGESVETKPAESGEQATGLAVDSGESEETEDLPAAGKDPSAKYPEQQQQQASDAVEDTEIAWEVLEVARGIFEKHRTSNPEVIEWLGKVHLRLGDLQKLNGNFVDAARDYERCLELRNRIIPANDRRIADVHYSLAQVHEYCAAEPDHADRADDLTQQSMTHYKSCLNIFAAILAERESSPNGNGKGTAGVCDQEQTASQLADIAEYRDILVELQETIDALEQGSRLKVLEMKQSVAGPQGVTTNGFGAPATPGAGVETIGFGRPSIAPGVGVETIGFGRPITASNSSTERRPEPMMLAVKKKTKRPLEDVTESLSSNSCQVNGL